MSKTVKNRIGNALVLSFIASIGWGIVGGLIEDWLFGINMFIAMYIPLFILMIILVYIEPELDLFTKNPGDLV